MTGLTDDQIRQTYEAAKEMAAKDNKDITAAIVKKAAGKFKPAKPVGNAKSKAKKAIAGKSINLSPALKLLARAEEAAEKGSSKLVVKELVALRKCLEDLAAE